MNQNLRYSLQAGKEEGEALSIKQQVVKVHLQ
jgi:hypothetical protein